MKWTEKEIFYLKSTYPTKTPILEIISFLKKSRRSINHKAVRLGLSRLRIPINRPKNLEHRLMYDKNYYTRHRNQIYLRKQNRLRSYKAELIKILGGRCVKCGYDKCQAALDFHHHANNKESEVMRILKDSSKEKALKEAMKCTLLCANCHRELHYKGP